jgi:two-component system, response regulator PdtaR
MEQLLQRGREAKERTQSLLEELRPMKAPTLNVLVVEDNQQTLDWLTAAIHEAGHVVVAQAMTGPEMVKEALTNDIDLILFDIHLPGCDGFEALDQITAKRLLPAVVVTGDTDPDMLMRSMEKHVLGHLYKPIERSQAITAAVNVAWARWVETKALREEKDTAQQTLERRKVVEKAKGILMRRQRMGEEQAFKYLQKFSMDNRVPLLDVAKSILEGRSLESLVTK